MAEHEDELSQRHVGVQEQHNGRLTDPECPVDETKPRDTEEQETPVLWKRPLLTLYYFSLELLITLKEWIQRLWQQRQTVIGVLILLILLSIAYCIEGTHQQYVHYMERKTLWCAYWVSLGILSSVGLGTGLHTFLLYLGPHIASVTLAAHECGSVDFPEPPYPDQIICPQHVAPELSSDAEAVGVGSAAIHGSISLWTIMSKVRLEAFMWGAGTAIGELPPYFMARAARLSGVDPDDEDYQAFEEILDQTHSAQDFASRAKAAVQKLIHQVGFLGILACASIPNPLFDLAGITCGHFLVPFWTFFGATLIGKAVIKMHIQKLFVIITFSKHIVEQMVSLMGRRTGCRGSSRRLWSSWYASLSAPLSTPWPRATPSAGSGGNTQRTRRSEGQPSITADHQLQKLPPHRSSPSRPIPRHYLKQHICPHLGSLLLL